MKEERSSVTAGLIAAVRSLGATLPADAHIAHDPYGARFVGRCLQGAIALARSVPWAAKPFERYVLYMQVRTRALDDVLLDFVRSGGRQVVLLGAGFDARAIRFAEQLRDVKIFEVDHPATQLRKRTALEAAGASSPVAYLSFDFETQASAALASELAALGHAPGNTTLTIWEGVTMYLTEDAIDATVAAVRAYSAPRSLLALTYFDKRRIIQRPSWRRQVTHRFVKTLGEPWRFGWDENEIGPWFAKRGFDLVWNRSETELARSMLPVAAAARVEAAGRYIAVASVNEAVAVRGV